MDLNQLKTEDRNSRTTHIDTLSTIDMIRPNNEEGQKMAALLARNDDRVAAALGEE